MWEATPNHGDPAPTFFRAGFLAFLPISFFVCLNKSLDFFGQGWPTWFRIRASDSGLGLPDATARLEETIVIFLGVESS